MRELAVLFLHILATLARLAGPGGASAVVAESVLVKQQGCPVIALSNTCKWLMGQADRRHFAM
jgi:hypothetical protein